MASATEGKNAGDWLKWEEDNLFSREKITLEGGDSEDLDLKSGTVLGQLTSGGNYMAIVEGANDGSQTAAAILLLDTHVPDGVDTDATVIIRDAQIEPSGLTWPSSYDTSNKAAALVLLKAKGIIEREGA